VKACCHGGAITHGEPREEGSAISHGQQHPSASLLKCMNIAKLVLMFCCQSAERRSSNAISSVSNDQDTIILCNSSCSESKRLGELADVSIDRAINKMERYFSSRLGTSTVQQPWTIKVYKLQYV
jgi:hypothetical protein